MKRNRTIDEVKQPKKMTSIGGQALMEGLMMIGPQTMAMAVRLPDGQIHVETAPIGKSSIAAKIPFIRGSVKIFRQMVTGTRYLLRSAQFIEDDINKDDSEGIIADQPLATIIETGNESATTDESATANESATTDETGNRDNEEIQLSEDISENEVSQDDSGTYLSESIKGIQD